MSYVYLLDLYQVIDTRIDAAKRLKNNERHDLNIQKFQEGRIEILSDIKTFLIRNLNAKLPRALRKQVK